MITRRDWHFVELDLSGPDLSLLRAEATAGLAEQPGKAGVRLAFVLNNALQ
jgi:hypothetical protein